MLPSYQIHESIPYFLSVVYPAQYIGNSFNLSMLNLPEINHLRNFQFYFLSIYTSKLIFISGFGIYRIHRILSNRVISWHFVGHFLVPMFQMSLDLPQLKHLKNVAEKMKNLSPLLSIYASNDGMLILKIDTDSACVSTHFPGLHVHQQNETDEERLSVTVDVKKFLMFLAWDAVHPETVKCSFRRDHMVYLHLNLNDNFKIHYFLPATVL